MKQHSPSPLQSPNFFAIHSIVSLILLPSSTAILRLPRDSSSSAFLHVPARFSVPISGSPACGFLHVADPLDACSPILANASFSALEEQRSGNRFVIIKRGLCSFDHKVRVAQDAGFDAAIVFDDQDIGCLFSMVGDPLGIYIHAIFISKKSGETLLKHAHGEGEECCIGSPTVENAGTVLVISFVSVVVMISVLALLFFARNYWILRNAGRKKHHYMAIWEVETIPYFKFKSAYRNDKCAFETCAICLEDYENGQQIRLLPCRHDFHSACVDSWLTKWGTSCPICKFELCD